MHYFIFISLLLFVSCNEHESINEIPITGNSMISIGLKNNDTSYLKDFSALFSSPQIIPLSSSDSSFFVASIQKIIVYNNEIFVLDDRFSNLLRFDSMGRYLNAYGKIGLGKNEYQKIHDFDIDTTNKRVLVFSNSNKSIYYYSLQTGSFIKKLNINLFGSKIALLSNGEILLYRSFSSEGSKQKKYDYNILILDSLGNKVGKAFPFNSDISNVEWKGSGFLRSVNNKFFFANTFSDTIYRYVENKFEPFIKTDILSEKLKTEKDDHHKLIRDNTLSDSLTGYLGSSFIANSQFAIFDFVKKRRSNIGVLNFVNKNCTLISSLLKTDPYISAGLVPLYIAENGDTYFKIDTKNLQYMKSKLPLVFDKFSKSEKKIFSDSSNKSGAFLLKTQIKRY